MVFSAGNRTMTRCARAAVAAAEDAAFMRKVFRGDASVDYASAKGLTPQAGAELALATAQPRAFAQWSAASPTFVPEHTDTHDDTTEAAIDAAAKMMTGSTGGKDFAGDPFPLAASMSFSHEVASPPFCESPSRNWTREPLSCFVRSW
ncbi:hypothetical protein ZWY2020_010127 [Hordeum vulgare]|nr:hypothetical protein ZWY2020_010127 [Hordeum vulgare]